MDCEEDDEWMNEWMMENSYVKICQNMLIFSSYLILLGKKLIRICNNCLLTFWTSVIFVLEVQEIVYQFTEDI